MDGWLGGKEEKGKKSGCKGIQIERKEIYDQINKYEWMDGQMDSMDLLLF